MGSERLIRRIRLQLLPCLHESPHGTVLFARNSSYKDIKKATDGFHRIIYENSRGTAYKARSQDGGVAMIKEVRYSSQENDVFYREVQLLARHLLPLKGFSTGNKRFDAYYFVSSSLNKALSTVKSKKYYLGTEAGGEFRAGRDQLKLLIFDNIECGSLKEDLNDPLRTPLNWTTRLQITAGVVVALELLTELSEKAYANKKFYASGKLRLPR